MMCQKCRQISNFDAKLFEGPIPPQCPQCIDEDNARTNVAGKRSHGIGRMRPRIVLYNEHNPDDEAIGAVSAADCRTRPDAVVVVGTSMKIPGVRRIVSQMCRIVRDRREGTTIWINRDGVPTGKDLEDCWDLIVKGDSDEVARLVNQSPQDEPVSEAGEEYTESDVEKVMASQGKLQVDIPSPEKKLSAANIAMQKFSMSAMTPPRSQNGESNPKSASKQDTPPVKLKLTFKASKMTEKPEPAAKSAATRNPASDGRKLSDVLNGKDHKRKPGRPKSSLNTKKSTSKKAAIPQANQGRIVGKVTKKSAVIVNPAKKEPLSPRKGSKLNMDHQQAEWTQLSRVEQLPTPDNISLNGDAFSSPSQTAGTISPNGNVPLDMRKLLN